MSGVLDALGACERQALRPHPDLPVEGGHKAETSTFPGAKVLVLEAAKHPVPHVLQTAEVRWGEKRRRLLQPIQARDPQGRPREAVPDRPARPSPSATSFPFMARSPWIWVSPSLFVVCIPPGWRAQTAPLLLTPVFPVPSKGLALPRP